MICCSNSTGVKSVGATEQVHWQFVALCNRPGAGLAGGRGGGAAGAGVVLQRVKAFTASVALYGQVTVAVMTNATGGWGVQAGGPQV